MKKQTLTIESNSPQETQEIAFKIGNLLQSGALITLHGELAAGKTTFTQGLARGLKIEDNINSPTFVIMKEYEGFLPLIHIDAYRLEGLNQDLGFEDVINQENVVVIEWSEYLDFVDEYNAMEIKLERISESSRLITITFDSDFIDRLKETL